MPTKVAYLLADGQNFGTIWKLPNDNFVCHLIEEETLTSEINDFNRLVTNVKNEYQGLTLIVQPIA